MNLVPRDEAEWRKVRILKTSDKGPLEEHIYAHEFWLPMPLAEWDVFDYWERERFDSMKAHLKQGDVLFDIGTEQGWCNLIYATFVGPRNMVLIEPTPEFWPNIQATWYRNFKAMPKGFYDGLFSDKTTDTREYVKQWPSASNGLLIDRNSYKYIHEHGDQVPQMMIDDYVERSGIVPDALTMDTEGSELLILQGARETLEKHKPKVWVSIHPTLSVKDYGTTKDDVLRFMELVGYHAEYLATDHEEHWYFEAKK